MQHDRAPPPLYRHALESIFGFASMRELHAIVAVNRDWSSAVMSMQPIAAIRQVSTRVQLHRLLGGRLRRHVSSLFNTGHGTPFRLTVLEDLVATSTLAPGLTQLHMHIGPDEVETACAALARFQQLHDLLVWAPQKQPTHTDNRIIDTIGQLNPKMMHTLVLSLDIEAGISFAPLAALTTLRSFSLTIGGGGCWSQLTDLHIQELRAMTSVQQLSLAPSNNGNTNSLERMLQPGHALQWTRVQFQYADIFITDPLAAVLGSIPTLTSLDAILACTDLVFLPQLSALTDVGLCGAFPPAALVSALRQCPQITELRLTQFALTGQHLVELFPSFRRLSAVRLFRLGQLESLRCFATAALAESLMELELCDLPLCPTTEITHLFGLRSLTFIFIERMAAPLSDEHEAQFQVPSLRFPALKEGM